MLKGPCNVCGQDHHHFECTKTPCKGCKQRPCQGTRGMACWLELEDKPVYTDFSGAKLHPKLQERFNGMRTAKGLPVSEISSLELCFMCDDENAVEAEVEPVTMIQVASLEISGVERVVSNVESSNVESSVGSVTVRVQMDCGANTSMLRADSPITKVSTVTGAGGDALQMASDSSIQSEGEVTMLVSTNADPNPAAISAVISARARRDIVSVSMLWRDASIAMLPAPWNLIVHGRTGRVASIVETNGLYFLTVRICDGGIYVTFGELCLPIPASSLEMLLTAAQPEAASALTIQAAQRTTVQEQQVWAIRFGVDATGLARILPATQGMPFSKVTPAAAVIIDSDTIRKGVAMRKTPRPNRIRPADAPSSPGTHGEIDGWGHMSVGSIADGGTYMWTYYDSVSDFGYASSTKSSSQESCLNFLVQVYATEVSLGHTPKVLKVDAVPNLNTPSFRKLVFEQFQVHVPTVGGGDHDHIPHCEAAQDPATRRAEAMVKRASKPKNYFILARIYAVILRNFCVKKGESKSRYHIHVGKPVDVTVHPPYSFGIDINVLVDKAARGGLAADRFEQCELVGLSASVDSQYVVLRSSTRTVVLRRDVQPIGELQLAMQGIPSGGTAVDAEVQVDVEDLPELPLPLPAAPPPAPSVKLVPGYDPLPDGTPLELGFKDEHGATVFYGGKIAKSHRQPSGKIFTEIVWDDAAWADDPQWKGRLFDLTSQHHPWRQLTTQVAPVPPAGAPLPPASKAPSEQKKRTPPTRASVRVAQQSGATAAVAAAVECLPSNKHVDAFHDEIFHHHGSKLEIECNSLEQLDDARRALLQTEAMIIDGQTFEVGAMEVVEGVRVREVSAAAGRVKQLVKTSDGEYIIEVPRNKAEHAASPHKVSWDVSHDKAHLTMLNDRRNSLVKIKDVKAEGRVIAPCVMEDSIKVDRSSGYLDRFKSRLCYDEARVTKVKAKIGRQEYHHLYSNDTDQMTFKMFIGDALIDQDDVTGADLPDAYWQADRVHTEYCWMHTYEPLYDEEGDQLCYQCGAPVNGERTAGSDYHIWRDGVFEKAGCTQSITCLGTFFKEDGDGNRATVITCSDDFLIKETKGNNKRLANSILDAFDTHMQQHGAKVKRFDRPSAFMGYGLAWSRDNSVCTLHMTSHIEQLAAKWIPDFLDGGKAEDIVSGNKLCHMADRMAMVDPRPHVLGKQQKQVQQMGGGIKYIETAVSPRVSRLMHKISCVSAASPPDAHAVCRSVIAILYSNKHEGITFGGGGLSPRVLLQGGMYANLVLADGAPPALEGMADASTAENATYAIAITYNGGLVHHAVKKVRGVVASSCHGEGKGSTMASEGVELCRNAPCHLRPPPRRSHCRRHR